MKKLALALTVLALSTPAMAEWVHVEDVDLMTDKDSSFIYASTNRDSALAVRCNDSGSFDIAARFDYLGDKYKTVTVRFDDNEPVNFSAHSSTNGRFRMFTDNSKSEVLNGMKKHNRMVIRALDFRGTPKTEVYDLKGFTAAANKLACLPK